MPTDKTPLTDADCLRMAASNEVAISRSLNPSDAEPWERLRWHGLLNKKESGNNYEDRYQITTAGLYVHDLLSRMKGE